MIWLGHFSIFQMVFGLQKNPKKVSKLELFDTKRCLFPHQAREQNPLMISRKKVSLFVLTKFKILSFKPLLWLKAQLERARFRTPKEMSLV